MTDHQQPQPGDRVRVTYDATVDEIGLGGTRVVLRGGMYFCQVPPGATVEVLQPPTLAERMAALADELERDPHIGGYGEGTAEGARRIRKELTAHEADALAKLREKLADGTPCPATTRSLFGDRPFIACQLPAGHEGLHHANGPTPRGFHDWGVK
jgi:hypothetical protein